MRKKRQSKPGRAKTRSKPLSAFDKQSRMVAKVAAKKVWPERGIDATGFALVHKKSRRIVLATIRADKAMTKELGRLYQVNGSYRVASVIVREP